MYLICRCGSIPHLMQLWEIFKQFYHLQSIWSESRSLNTNNNNFHHQRLVWVKLFLCNSGVNISETHLSLLENQPLNGVKDPDSFVEMKRYWWNIISSLEYNAFLIAARLVFFTSPWIHRQTQVSFCAC